MTLCRAGVKVVLHIKEKIMIEPGKRNWVWAWVYLVVSSGVMMESVGAQDKGLNIARPDIHPYVHPEGNRDLHDYSYNKVNEARVYDFYQRQADYYLQREEQPEIIPSFPGLDAGQHGHWGKYNQNNHNDGRWNDIVKGTVYAQVYRNDNYTVEKGVNLGFDLEGDHSLGACFDPVTGTYPVLWQDGFINIDPYRWGTSRNAKPAGPIWFQGKGGWNKPVKYHGYSRHNEKVVFQYSVGTTRLLDFPCADLSGDHPVFTRTLEFQSYALDIDVWIGPDTINTHIDLRGDLNAFTYSRDGNTYLRIIKAEKGASLILSQSQGASKPEMKDLASDYNIKAKDLLNPGSPQWPDRLQVMGEMGKSRDNAPYVVDTMHPPFENPYNTVMQLTGIDFLPDGDALISVLCGEVWKVSGLNENLESVTWKRFATGLNQPIGIHIDSDGIFVLCRDQLTRLHDLNGDDEVDFYECYTHDFGGYDRSHTHVFGLHRASDGSFSFVRREQLVRTSPDPERKTREIAFGVRNCMGVGGAPDGPFLVAPQEGSWTPASAILEVTDNAFFGLPGNRKDDSRFSPASIMAPLCFVPRGVDNSTGGMVYIDSDRWGPFSGSFVGLSYGYGQYYIILRNTDGSVPQGGIVPLEGEFAAGVMRGAFHPGDGQLYTVGLDGWGDYSTQDGCFHRVRYTGRQVFKPIAFHTFDNGLQLEFPSGIDPQSIDLNNIFVQQWNYEYSQQYGSPEYSVNNPSSLGHDRLKVTGTKLSSNGRNLFLEIPDIQPVMQLHVRIHLTSVTGQKFASDFFTTIHELDRSWSDDGNHKESTLQKLAMRIKWSGSQEPVTETGDKKPNAKKLILNATSGLKFKQTLFEVKPGEPLVLHFINSDAMPHNVVFVTEGNVRKVGEASFRMLNDPDAAKKHYVPDNSTEVIANTHVINPGNTHILHFTAPTTPGDHHFVCTFPGHWMTMQGILRVQ